MTRRRYNTGILSTAIVVVAGMCCLPARSAEEFAKPKYAPGVLVVKFKQAAADQLKAALVWGEPLHQVSISASVDLLGAKHGLTNMRMLFPGFQVRDADGAIMRIETMREHVERIRDKFPVRAARDPGAPDPPDLTRWFKLSLDPAANIPAAVADYAADPAVEQAEPDYILQLCWHPNDYFYNTGVPGSWGQPYDDLWGIKRINCEAAWDYSRGSGIVIAIIDSGIWYRRNPPEETYDGHPDIKPNLWVNYLEYIGAPGHDDDENGYVDDIWGWNFVDPALDPNDPIDKFGHGTHVAGIAAAVSNQRGVVGVAPEAKVMNLKVAKDAVDVSCAAEAIHYAADNGADILNCSFGGESTYSPVEEAVSYAWWHGCVIVCAAGNKNGPVVSPGKLNRTIAVAGTNYQDDRFAGPDPEWGSHWGTSLDVAAPGGGASDIFDILSLRSVPSQVPEEYWVDDPVHGDIYLRYHGTSLSCPQVAGLAALIMSYRPYLNNEEVRQAIRSTAVDRGDAGHDVFYGAGRIDAAAAVNCAHPCAAVILQPQHEEIFRRIYTDEYPAADRIDISGIADGYYFSHWKVEYRLKQLQANWVTVATGFDRKYWYYGGEMGTLYLDEVPDGQYVIRLTVYDSYGNPYYHHVSVLVCTVRHGLDCNGWGDCFDVASTPLIADTEAGRPGSEVLLALGGEVFTPGWIPGPLRAMANDGTVLWDYTWEEGHRGSPAGTASSPVCAELVQDPQHPGPEIVVGSEDPAGELHLHAVHSDGTLFWNYPAPGQTGVRSSPAVAELVDDPQHPGPEIVFGHNGNAKRVYCLHSDGTLAWQSAASLAAEHSSPAVDDIDPGCPGSEIAIGSEDPQALFILRSDGTVLRQVAVGGPVKSSPAIADILPQYTGKEVVFGSDDDHVYAYSCSADEICWSYDTGGDVQSSPAIADLTPTYAGLEIVVGSDAQKVLCLHCDGSLAWEFPTGAIVGLCSPAIAKLDASYNILSVVIGAQNGGLWALRGNNGTPFWAFATNPNVWISQHGCWVAVGDIRPDLPGLEVAMAVPKGSSTWRADAGYAYIFHFPYAGIGTPAWPMFHHDIQHTGLYGYTP